ncbi:Cathepsin_B [Hexamita inflata]|uniref:Cathepsin_B n=1 Tax=Hexamita inflata TaxID=28002 RepID=A0ABP1H7M9_9EUKA
MLPIISSIQISLNEHLEVLKNIPGLTWTPGIPQYLLEKSDSELNAIFAPKQSNIPKHTPQKSKQHRSTIDPPDFLDWSKTRPECINNIRDMKNCGTSQTFSTISVLSDQRCIQHNDTTHVQYSEQFVINCNENGAGCQYMVDRRIPDYLMEFGTVPDSCFSYKSGENGSAFKCPSTCDDGTPLPILTKIRGYDEISEEWADDKPVFEMEKALMKGPITVLFNVYEDFMFYTGGIYQHSYGQFLDFHRGEVVGYDEEEGVEYWKIKFSFGTGFGENGFVRIAKGQDECQIENYALVYEI